VVPAVPEKVPQDVHTGDEPGKQAFNFQGSDMTITTDYRFPRQVRLLNSNDYQRVFQNAHCKSSDRYLTLLAHRNQSGLPRLGLAITKKKIKTAVARHRIKRLVRESFRRHKQLLSGLDIVVMGSTPAMDIPNHKLSEQLEKHWHRLISQNNRDKVKLVNRAIKQVDR
jgi:ribonuclease P protein component